MENILDEVRQERAYQDSKWGGTSFDDQHDHMRWIAFVTGYLGGAYSWAFDRTKFRTAMVKVAALAVAAVEWCDRKHPEVGS